MTDFPYIAGTDITAIRNKEFIRIETDKAQAICIALDKGGITYAYHTNSPNSIPHLSRDYSRLIF